ncbi:hypothetical protein EV401DRAFT_1910742, partial [Pisolithus croceorrhizus]
MSTSIWDTPAGDYLRSTATNWLLVITIMPDISGELVLDDLFLFPRVYDRLFHRATTRTFAYSVLAIFIVRCVCVFNLVLSGVNIAIYECVLHTLGGFFFWLAVTSQIVKRLLTLSVGPADWGYLHRRRTSTM